MRKPTDDQTAREAATRSVACQLDEIATATSSDEARTAQEVAEDLLEAWPYAEQETVTRDVQGERVTLRRVVLTGPWNVVHDLP
jgi:hypothetical protein